MACAFALRRSLACELGPAGVRVVTLQTGGILQTASAINITCGSVAG
jgi:NAD(P)-dependent dehydrogenase (short-subunit alcohol dehydrogenase family)